MSARVRWGFDRKAGAKARPVPLVRAYRGPWPDMAHRSLAEAVAPVPARPSARVSVEKIGLGGAPSGMESAARQWIKPASLAVTAPLPPVSDCDGKAWCGGCDARVPIWFGRDCIATQCDLRGRA